MIDSIELYLSQDDVRDVDLIAEIPNYLTNPKESYPAGRVAVKGHLGNMLVTAKEHGLFIKGSIPKYLQGDNIRTSDYEGVLMAFEKLSDNLKIRPDDLKKAKVNRLDMAATLKVNQLETDYFQHLGSKPRYYRYEQGSTVYYNSTALRRENQRTKEVFYSKTKEMEKANKPILKDFRKANLFRYETRILQPYKYFGGTITINQLNNKSFYKKCIDKWSEEYNSINKISFLMQDYAMVKNPKNLDDYVLAKLINLVGVDAVLKIPDDFKRHKAFDRKEYYSRTRYRLLERLKYISEFAEQDLIKELNYKIAEAAAEQIEGLKY